ncbi:hypothetical protein [Polaribacter cellanae]|uniref:Uncharacterized protein n=1 Tax=Polaribacter cellanae TaxID=2818493 RepID=A0A975H7F4_9FLAO|nr:hypothetical protein [Polaribacter cellanae]QTE23461.1 hypothetical protein J3359_04045 [Polaribacter cellanae]
MNVKKHTLQVIVTAQFFYTPLWFVENKINLGLIAVFQISKSIFRNLTVELQFSFITGLLLFTLFIITNRFSLFKVYFNRNLLK